MVGLLKFLFFAILAYYFFVFVSRFLLSFFLKRWVGKIKKNFNHQHKEKYHEKKKGETVVQYEKDSKIDPGGEYVDFEDIENE